jgi:D-alanyl-D-alanine-carboxypeptidase/D-alanyl-D-alanine-endopeptidase
MYLIKFIIFIFISFPIFLFSQNLPVKGDIEKIFSSYLADTNITGLAVGIIFNDSTRIYCFGKMNKSDTSNINGSTIFEIGSITKTFTADLLSLRILQNKMSMEDPIDKYLPDSVKLLPKMQNKINLFSLVTHTSGFPRLPGDFVQHMKYDSSDLKINYSLKDLYNYLGQYSNKKKIGKYVNYSNLGIGLLGNLLELQSKEEYDSLVIKEICSPLGMDHTKIKPDPEENELAATGYTKGKAAVNWGFNVFEGASSLRSNLNDMLLYLKANMYKSDDTLSSAIFNTHVKLHKFSRHNNIGMCWIIHKNKKGSRTCWHNGATSGFRSFIAFNEKEKYGVVILANSDTSLDNQGFKIIDLLKELSKKAH